MHCRNEDLLWYLDGELPILRRFRAGRHLRSCEQCRARLALYEREMLQLNRALDAVSFPGPEWTRDAKRRLNQRLLAFEASFPLRTSPYFGGWALRASLAAASVILCFGVWFQWMRDSRPALRPADVIAHASTVEQELYQQPVHQTFSVEIARVRPAPQAVSTHLEIWSDRRTGRFASRLREPGGAVKHALWRPSADAEFLYRPAVSRSIVRQAPHRTEPVSLASLADYGLEPAQLEAGFMRWLESRSWSAISFASDISLWSAEDGTILRAERVRGGDGNPAVRITAERKSRRLVAVLSVDIDSNSYRPHMQRLRFETPERAVELRLAATSIRPVAPVEVAANVYSPDPKLAAGEFAAVAPRPIVPPSPSLADPRPGEAGVDSPEVEAHYVLHKAGACLGQAVRVTADPDGTRVWKLGPGGGASVEGFTTSAGMEFVLGALADLRRRPPTPIDDGNLAAPGEALAAALRHAWAIASLAADYPPERLSGMSERSRSVLALIVREHVESLDGEVSKLGFSRPAAGARRPRGADWRQPASVLFEDLARLRPLLREHPAGDEAQLLGKRICGHIEVIRDGVSPALPQRGHEVSESRRPR